MTRHFFLKILKERNVDCCLNDFVFILLHIHKSQKSINDKKILSKFSLIVSKHDVLTYIFCIFFAPNPSPMEYQIATGLSHRSQTD